MKTKKYPSFHLVAGLLFTLGLLLISHKSEAQNNNPTSEWSHLLDSSNISVSYQYVICGSESKVLLKFENLGETTTTFQWSLFFDGNIITETLAASQTKTGTCGGETNPLARKIPAGFPTGSTPPLFKISIN